MKRLMVALFALVLLVGARSTAADLAAESRHLGELISLVDDAAELVRTRGEEAFADFNRLGSRWYNGNRYVIVAGLDGMVYVCPPEPKLEGRVQLELRDVDGRYLILLAKQVAEGPEHAGWVHYRWPRPGHDRPAWKSVYLQKVTSTDGREYMVGAGIYPSHVYREFVVDTVDRAAAMVAEQGPLAFGSFSEPLGPFVYWDTYIFVLDESGRELVNGGSPDSVGREFLDMQDVDGRFPGKEIFDVLRHADRGWVNYKWFRPVEERSEPIATYFRRVKCDAGTYIICAGTYQD